ncbi:unnamed protein product [Menidia menidia]|uniref:(Atlantic silverside) hypothetical protein n=1 Tax=Menidia menidia TaxID=238744 RepID=A0A8S4B090_9TELE|nr:unnamed protein product [Menidia menidia]
MTTLEAGVAVQSTMEHDLRMGLSLWSIVAIVCNSVVGVLILILFVILYKACKGPLWVPGPELGIPHPEVGGGLTVTQLVTPPSTQ